MTQETTPVVITGAEDLRDALLTDGYQRRWLSTDTAFLRAQTDAIIAFARQEAAATPTALDVERLALMLHLTAPVNHNIGEGPARAICNDPESHASRARAIADAYEAER